MKGYHVCQNMLDPEKGEIIKAETEPMNSVDKYAVAPIRGRHFIEHLTEKFAITIF